MKNKFTFQTLIGLGILVAGGLMLANNLNIIKFDAWHLLVQTFWAVVLLAAGWQAARVRAWFWMILCWSFALSLSLPIFGVAVIGFWGIFWPAIVILFGLSLIFDLDKSKTNSSKRRPSNSTTAIFWGAETRIEDEYDGGNVTAVFGGVDLDLRRAKIKDGTVIEIFTLCGGVDILLPEDVAIDNQIVGILGGVGDGTHPNKSAKATLVVRGQCILGGVDIK